ncbi:MAG TPA: zinc ribbon domain-containing protein [Caldithrix sp.]|nr:zinc ribbon domain-containing protein [Caldithrix sp.]
MYCKNCGRQLPVGAEFCKECGEPVQKKAFEKERHDDSRDQKKDPEEEKSPIEQHADIIKKHGVFFSDDEILIDTLGSGFLSSVIVQKEMMRSVLICSNKRVYQKGKLFWRDYRRKIIYSKGEAFVYIKDITGMYYEVAKPIYRFGVIGIMLLLIPIGLLIAQEVSSDIAEIIYVMCGVIFFFTLISAIAYYATKEKWFVIQHAGGELCTKCNWYSTKSISRFMKNVSIQKDLITNYRSKT